MATTAHHKVVIVGGGSAGISVAARLREFDYTMQPRRRSQSSTLRNLAETCGT